jgi:hypothetical protein
MTSTNDRDRSNLSAQHPEFSFERISRLISALEQELANAPADLPNVKELREEIDTLKHALAAPEKRENGVGERLHAIRDALQGMSAKVEGEVLKDSPYIAEIGRILGLV